MYLGAVTVSINANKSFNVITTGAKSVGSNFDDKETVNWNRDLFDLNLGDPAVYPYPKAVLTALVLAEHDSGNGRNKFIERLAQDFRKQFTQAAIEAAIKQQSMARTASGSVAMAIVPAFVVGAIKEVAKEKLKDIANSLINTASEWAGDEIFPTALKVLDIPAENHTWNGQRQTPEEAVEFVGHKGKYVVTMCWKLR
jgi:hypothetical protein